MSFSSELKEELSKINNLSNKNEVKFELLGYLVSRNASVEMVNSNCNNIIIEKDNLNYKNTSIERDNLNCKNIRYATESDYNINRFSKLLKNLDINHDIEFDGKSFVITFNAESLSEIYNKALQFNEKITVKTNNKDLKENLKFDKKITAKIDNKNFIENISGNEKRAILRGAFLGAGSINNPENTYHLEINLSSKGNMDFLYELLKNMGITSKKLETNKYCIYIKDGDEISNVLILMGANKSVLNFENIRVQRDMNAKINRIVNCKTANLNKTLNASVEQVNAIKRLKESSKFNMLNDNLKEMAEIRLEFPDASLEELGKKLKNPVGKSGVNYRLKKIIQIANEE